MTDLVAAVDDVLAAVMSPGPYRREAACAAIRTVLAQIREPTPGMIAARDNVNKNDFSAPLSVLEWRAMIDAIEAG